MNIPNLEGMRDQNHQIKYVNMYHKIIQTNMDWVNDLKENRMPDDEPPAQYSYRGWTAKANHTDEESKGRSTQTEKKKKLTKITQTNELYADQIKQKKPKPSIKFNNIVEINEEINTRWSRRQMQIKDQIKKKLQPRMKRKVEGRQIPCDPDISTNAIIFPDSLSTDNILPKTNTLPNMPSL